MESVQKKIVFMPGGEPCYFDTVRKRPYKKELGVLLFYIKLFYF